MAKSYDSEIKFSLRIGGDVNDELGGTWFDFESVAHIEDWSGLLSSGPVSGDIIEQDMTAGALWQPGYQKTYSFDVPFVAKVNPTYEPNIWHAYYEGIRPLYAFRGPLLTLRRQFLVRDEVVWTSTALGVWVSDIPQTVGIGRVIHGVAVFQNLTGFWIPSQSTPIPAPPSVKASLTASNSFTPWGGTITFTDMSTGSPTAWAWNFGNGAVPATANTRGPHTVTYSGTPGNSSVTLTAGNSDGSDAAYPWIITVQPPPLPVAGFIASVSALLTGEAVLFTDTSTSSPAPITTWAWNFGAGATPATATTKGPHSVVYATKGTSTITLTVGNVGGTDAATPLSLPVSYPKAATLVEDFSDPATIDSRWTYTTGSTANVTFGAGQCNVAWGGSTTNASLVSKYNYDLVGSSVIMEAVSLGQVKVPGIAFNMVTLWDKTVTKYVSFRVTGVPDVPSGTVPFLQAYNSVTGAVGTGVNWNLVNHRWLRISESNGTIFWHTSPDRTTWTQLGSISAASLTGWTATEVRMGVLADLGGAGVPASMCNIDNINTTGTRQVASSLTDSFNTLDLNTWTPTSGITTSSGVCNVNWGGTLKAESMVTDSVYSLVGSAVYMELVFMDKAVRPFDYHVVEIWNEAMTNSVSFRIAYNAALPGGIGIQPFRYFSGGSGGLVAFNPDTHPLLRISEASGTLSFHSSVDDGSTWTLVGNGTFSIASDIGGRLWDPSAIRVGFGISTPTNTRVGTLTVLQVDNVNSSTSITWDDYSAAQEWQQHSAAATWADLNDVTDLT